MRTSRGQRPEIILAVVLGLGSFAVYLRTLAPGVLMGDSGEFQFAAYLLGVAHPTGYPLYLTLGWLWSHLIPFGDPAYRMNLFSAIWAAATVSFLYLFVVRTLHLARGNLGLWLRRVVAILSTLSFALSFTFWGQVVMAEVYTFNSFFVALLFYLLLRRWPEARGSVADSKAQSPDRPPLLLLAFLYGLSLAHHRTTLLLAPAVLLYLWLTERSMFNDAKLWLKAIVLVLVPLSLYLYIPLRAPATPYLRLTLEPQRELILYSNTPQGFLDFILGRVFSPQLGYGGQGLERLGMAFELLRQQYGWAGLSLGLLGLAGLLLNRRWPLLTLFGLSYLSLVLFNLFYSIGDIEVLYIPAYLIFAGWIAVGMSWVLGTVHLVGIRGRQQVARVRYLAAGLILLLLILLPVSLFVRNFQRVDRSDDLSAGKWWDEILSEPIPEGAILVSNDRNEIMPLWYMQYVEGKRPDLLGLFPLIVPGREYANVVRVIEAVRGGSHPVFLIKEMPGLEIKYRLVRHHSLVQVVGPAVEGEPDYPRQIGLGETVELQGYDLDPFAPRPGEAMKVVLYWRALVEGAEDYVTFVHLVDSQGRIVAQSDHRPGGDYYPPSLWQRDEVLRDEHLLAIPEGVQNGAYGLKVGIYGFPSPDTLAHSLVLRRVGIKKTVTTSLGTVSHPLLVNFADTIALRGYDLVHEEGTIRLTLHWQALARMEEDYTIFVHLVDERGQLLAQDDGQPRAGGYPTSIWDEGEVVTDEHRLSTVGLPEGSYQLRVGFYLLETLQRLPVLDEEGNRVGDSITLRGVTVR
ncbi:MAG: DUF2723 domain-containing protein [Anaerolineae bacterium]